jgi:hypothetical protein
MPASDEMESGFCFSFLETACPQAVERKWRQPSRREGAPAPLQLMHAGRYAVTAIGPDTCRAAAERAENHDRGDEGE